MSRRHHQYPNLSKLLFATLTALCLPLAQAQQTKADCNALHHVGSQVYADIRSAWKDRDYTTAYRLKNVFWGIEKYGRSCTAIRIMGNALAERKLGPDDELVSGSFGISGGTGSTASSTDAGGFGSSGTTGSAGTSTSSATSSSAGNTPTSGNSGN
jgi:hypothetical protein